MPKTYQTIRLVLSLYHNVRNAGLQSTVIVDFIFVAAQFLCFFSFRFLLSCHALVSEHTSTVGDAQDKERIYWEYQIKCELKKNLEVPTLNGFEGFHSLLWCCILVWFVFLRDPTWFTWKLAWMLRWYLLRLRSILGMLWHGIKLYSLVFSCIFLQCLKTLDCSGWQIVSAVCSDSLDSASSVSFCLFYFPMKPPDSCPACTIALLQKAMPWNPSIRWSRCILSDFLIVVSFNIFDLRNCRWCE